MSVLIVILAVLVLGISIGFFVGFVVAAQKLGRMQTEPSRTANGRIVLAGGICFLMVAI